MDLPENLRAMLAAIPGVVRVATRALTDEEAERLQEPGIVAVCVMSEDPNTARPQISIRDSAMLDEALYPSVVEQMNVVVQMFPVQSAEGAEE
jgi:hypothetical protein